MSGIVLLRRKNLYSHERFDIEFRLRLPALGKSMADKILSIVLVVAILGAVGTLIYVVATPKVGERFTEFYILGEEGKATDYPKELVVGEEGKVVIGIVNHEYETVNYQVAVVVNDVMDHEVGPIALMHEEKWEAEVSFIPKAAGDNQKVEFFLYKNGETEPSEQLRLWIDVAE
jgi:uncharacterized membrane protein